MAKKRPDPADFRFENKASETLVREPGQIAPYDFQIDSLDNCTVYLMDKIAEIKIDKVTNSRLHIGPVESACFLRDCSNCVVTVACSQLRTKNCSNLQIFLYCASDPSIELSTGLFFAPYNFSYPLQDQHFQAAGLDISQDFWSEVYDFNKVENELHWQLLQPQYYSLMNWEKEDLGAPVNPVPRHVSYGGSLTGEIVVGSKNHGDQGFASFDISTSQADAQRVIDSQPEIVSDPFGGAPSSDPFGQQSDPFAQPSDPFAQPSDPFATPADPFASQPPVQNLGPPEAIIESESDPEEAERQRLRDQEHQAFMRKLYEKEEKERSLIDQNKMRAKEELNKWYSNRANEIKRRKELNIEQEQLRKDTMKQYETENPWKKVATMIDFKEANDRKDIARMRALLIAKKHEG